MSLRSGDYLILYSDFCFLYSLIQILGDKAGFRGNLVPGLLEPDIYSRQDTADNRLCVANPFDSTILRGQVHS